MKEVPENTGVDTGGLRAQDAAGRVKVPVSLVFSISDTSPGKFHRENVSKASLTPLRGHFLLKDTLSED